VKKVIKKGSSTNGANLAKIGLRDSSPKKLQKEGLVNRNSKGDKSETLTGKDRGLAAADSLSLFQRENLG